MSKTTPKGLEVKELLVKINKDGGKIVLKNNGLFPGLIDTRVSARVGRIENNVVTLYVPNAVRSPSITIPIEQVFLYNES